MIEKKREIFIKLNNVENIVMLLNNIKEKELELKNLFLNYDKLNSQENKIFENWNMYLEDVSQKLDHVTL